MTKLHKRIAQLNAHAEALLDEMSLHGEEVLHRQPVPNAWTPLQTLHHIQLVERSAVDYLLYKFGSDEAPPPLTLATRLQGKLVAVALHSPMKFKAPAAVDSRMVATRAPLTLEQLSYQLRAGRSELAEVLQGAPPSWSRAAVFRHPRTRMSLQDMLRFFDAHLSRHSKQIRRALAQNARYYSRQKAR